MAQMAGRGSTMEVQIAILVAACNSDALVMATTPGSQTSWI